jgi:hypothetical protein
MKQKRALRDKRRLRTQTNGNFSDAGNVDENEKKVTVDFIQGLLHPAEANLGYFLAWFQSLQLP